jgi:hypothetical protein
MFMKFGMYKYIMPPEPNSAAYIIYLSHYSVCLYVYRSIVARQQLGESVYTRNNRRIVGLNAARVLSKETRLLVLPRKSCS